MQESIKLGYHFLVSNSLYFILLSIISAIILHYDLNSIMVYYDNTRYYHNNPAWIIIAFAMVSFVATVYYFTRPRPVYLLDFSCYKPENERKCTRELFIERSGLAGVFNDENLAFQRKILERSGLGQDTYFPEAVLRVPPNPNMAEARKEAEMVMFGAVDELLKKTRVKAKDIGVLVVNCSLFNPTPSLSAMIVNHYKLRGNIISYNLGGMGCSAGLISIDLAKQLLQVYV